MVRPIGKMFKTGSINPPPKKTTCIYLDENRICRCKKSPCCTEKCFEATWCTYKVKGKFQSKSSKKKHRGTVKTSKEIVLDEGQACFKNQLCKVGMVVNHIKLGEGKIISYSESQIVICFETGEKTFDLDTIIYNGYISLSN